MTKKKKKKKKKENKTRQKTAGKKKVKNQLQIKGCRKTIEPPNTADVSV